MPYVRSWLLIVGMLAIATPLFSAGASAGQPAELGRQTLDLRLPALRVSGAEGSVQFATAEGIEGGIPTNERGAPAVAEPVTASATTLAQLPLAFEPNRGQAEAPLAFVARAAGYSIGLRSGGAEIAFGNGESVRLRAVGGRKSSRLLARQRLPGSVNYLLGPDGARWQRNVPTYARVVESGIYPGIDLAYYGQAGRLEFDFVVHPGARPDQIGLRFEGAGGLRLDRGELVIERAGGELRVLAPRLYQRIGSTQWPVKGGFVIREGTVRFDVGDYDERRLLVIDPILSYASYLGGSGDDIFNTTVLDASGNAYFAGFTASSNFPTVNPYSSTYAAGDVIVSKLNAAGTALLYSTYLGGNGADWANGLAVDSAGNAYIAGYTNSTTFPTQNAYQPSFAGGPLDGFVTKLNPSGSGLVYSTYLGGSGNDNVLADVVVDASGNAYVAGFTSSSNFPTMNPYQLNFHGLRDVFLTKLTASGSGLVYSTYVGGTNDETPRGIALGPGDSVILAGTTASNDFPLANPYQPAHQGFGDGFLLKLNASGSTLDYSTFLGGNNIDGGRALAVDAAGNAYFAGVTDSTNFPRVGPYQGAHGGGTDGFVAKLNPNGSQLLYSTFLGGSGTDDVFGLAIDAAGGAHLTGATTSTNFPTASPHQGANAGDRDVFVSQLSASGAQLPYSSYLGGIGEDNGIAIAVGGANVQVAGSTRSTDFPTAAAYQSSNAGGSDTLLVRYTAAPTAVLIGSFSANRSPAGVRLRWQAASEAGVVGYELYRGERRLVFAPAGRRGGAYSYLDRAALPGGAARYRLRRVLTDGRRVWLEPALVVPGRE